jgi:lactoylglutathione lyase
MKVEANVKQVAPFLWVRDMQASVRFYVDGLGFKVTKDWKTDDHVLRWCWLEIGDAALMLQEFWKEGPDSNLPQGPMGVGVCIHFQCRDALALYREFRSRRVEAKTPVVGNGLWVVSLEDPDGYQLAFESPTDAPEDTVYTDAG